MASVFDNLSIKLVALGLGLLLWFHVATEKVYNYELQLPVTRVALNDGLTLSRYPPESLKVVVSATGKQLLRQKWRERGLQINAVQFPPGRHNIDLTAINTSLSNAGNLVSLDKIVYPTTTELYVDRRSETRLPVTSDLTALADDGFAVASITRPEPSEVTLTGPRTLLGAIGTVFTEHKELVGLRNSLTVLLPLVKPEGYGMTLDPDSVTLSVEVVPVRTRVFEDVPILLFNVPPDSEVTVNPAWITVILTGPPVVIDSLRLDAVVASADYMQAVGSGKVPVKIDCPSSLRVKSISVDSVAVVHR